MKFFTNYKSPLAVLIVLIIWGGMFAYSKMQTALFPEITFPKIKVIADAGEQPVDKMMVTVTKPIENAIKKVQDLQTVRSTTSRGSCEISAFMKPSPVYLYDYQKLDDIAELISKYNLLAIPVVDNDEILQGMVVIDDVIDDLMDKRKTHK